MFCYSRIIVLAFSLELIARVCCSDNKDAGWKFAADDFYLNNIVRHPTNSSNLLEFRIYDASILAKTLKTANGVRIQSMQGFSSALTNFNGKLMMAHQLQYKYMQVAPGMLGIDDDGGSQCSNITSVPIPDTSRVSTFLNLARMSANTYLNDAPDDPEFANSQGERLQTGYGYNTTNLRAQVYSNSNRSIIVIAFKGSSNQIDSLLQNSNTTDNDRANDNIMFSCCCAAQTGNSLIGDIVEDELVEDSCNCASNGRVCNSTCINNASQNRGLYYYQAIEIVNMVQEAYPMATIWYTGHSLGGAIAALMAVRSSCNGTSAITFGAPGELLYSRRISLTPEDASQKSIGQYRIFSYGLSKDPIYGGKCSGASSVCGLAGYAIQTKCRHGKNCVQQEENDDDLDILDHRIGHIISVLEQPGYMLPRCTAPSNCVDCDDWKFN